MQSKPIKIDKSKIKILGSIDKPPMINVSKQDSNEAKPSVKQSLQSEIQNKLQLKIKSQVDKSNNINIEH